MMNNHWIDLPDGYDAVDINQQSGTPFRDDEADLNLQSGTSFSDSGEATPSSIDNLLRLNDSYFREDDNCDGIAEKKKKTSRIIGWGLRRFSTIVCRKVQAKGRTTYNEVADEIIAELASGFDEKNIRRRVYDAFNVLIAIDVIAKEKKEIRWIGFPTTRTEASRQLQEVHLNMRNRIQAKVNHLKELEQQLDDMFFMLQKVLDLRKLMLRNQRLCEPENVSSEGIHLPLVLVQTCPKATVEIEISDDMHLVHFDFNETPYSLHDHLAILKMLRCPQPMETGHAARSAADDIVITDQNGMETGHAARSAADDIVITDQNGRPLKPSSFSWNSENMNL